MSSRAKRILQMCNSSATNIPDKKVKTGVDPPADDNKENAPDNSFSIIDLPIDILDDSFLESLDPNSQHKQLEISCKLGTKLFYF